MGLLPYNITIEDVFSGRSEARNRVSAHIFKELNLIEQWGSGINRIINACKEHELQTPKIAEQNDFFDIEFYRPQTITNDKKPESKNTQPELKDLLEQVTKQEQQELQPESLFTKVLTLILSAPKSRKEISVALGQKSISGQLNEVLGKLHDNEMIEWTIKDKPNSSKQKYKLTKRGLAFYALVKNGG